MKIRQATPEDVNAMLTIYAYYIEHTAITFAYTVPTIETYQTDMQVIITRYPCLVIEEDTKTLGFAYAQPMFTKKAYQWDVECTIYVDRNHLQQGIGKQLMHTLLQQLRKLGYTRAYSLITLPNVGSEEIHRTFGFTQAGILKKSGYKLHKWHDVAIFEKSLNPCSDEMLAPFSITSLADGI